MTEKECPCDTCRIWACGTCIGWKWLYFGRQDWEEIPPENPYKTNRKSSESYDNKRGSD